MQALKSARLLDVQKEIPNYPPNIKSPDPSLNRGGKRKGLQYDCAFLLQFQKVFKEKPTVDWDKILSQTVGDQSEPASARGNRAPGAGMGSRQAPQRSAMPQFPAMGAFVGGPSRTLPSGTTSADRFALSTQGATTGGRPTMSNPLAQFGPGRGGFPAPMPRAASNMMPGPAAGRTASRGGKPGKQRVDRAPSRREQEQQDRSMPLTSGGALEPIKVTEGVGSLDLSALGPMRLLLTQVVTCHLTWCKERSNLFSTK